MFTKGRYCRKS